VIAPWDIVPNDGEQPLRAYLLGSLAWDMLLSLQRRLVYEVSGDANLATVLICEHPPSLTMGRQASRVHVRLSPETLADRGWPLQWLPRGGGCWLHVPGQIALYLVLPLTALRLNPTLYVSTLGAALGDVVTRFCPDATYDVDVPGWRVRGRRVATIGTAIRSGSHSRVTAFGAVVNVNPDLELFEAIDCDGDAKPMSSLARESGFRVRVPTVRQQLLEAISIRYCLPRVSVFHHHPALPETDRRHANSARTREV
jgi:lipoyl(octanoyl) transferase